MATRAYNQDQLMLPMDINDLIEENSPVYTIEGIVDKDFVRELVDEAQDYQGPGSKRYHPLMMFRLLVLAYVRGIYSSRKIAKLAKTDIEFMRICAFQKPSFRSICYFRTANKKFLEHSYKKVYRIALEMGLASLGLISIDGTVIKADASKNKSAKTIKKWREISARCDEEVEKYIEKSNKIDSEEDERFGVDRDYDLPDEYKDKKYRSKKIKDALKKVEEEELAETTAVSLTDTDARMIKKKTGGTFQLGYNVGMAVDENQFIAEVEVTNSSSDQNLFEKCLTNFKKDYKDFDLNGTKILADNGCASGKNAKLLEDMGFDGFLAVNNEFKTTRKNKGKDEKEPDNTGNDKPIEFIYNEEKNVYICPAGQKLVLQNILNDKRRKNLQNEYLKICRFRTEKPCIGCPLKSRCAKSRNYRYIDRNEYSPAWERMKTKMSDEDNLEIYGKRRHTVEPTFGDIKHNNGFRSFSLRGILTKAEIGLVSMCHNLKKLHIMLQKPKALQQFGILSANIAINLA